MNKSLCIIRKYPPLMVIRKLRISMINMCPIWIRKNFWNKNENFKDNIFKILNMSNQDDFITIKISTKLYTGFTYKIPKEIFIKMNTEEIIKEVKK